MGPLKKPWQMLIVFKASLVNMEKQEKGGDQNAKEGSL